MIMARLIERVDLGDHYKVHIKFKISKAQFEGQQQYSEITTE